MSPPLVQAISRNMAKYRLRKSIYFGGGCPFMVSNTSTIMRSNHGNIGTRALLPFILTKKPFLTDPRRCMGSGGGSRGARGHGWFVNYRQGKGGRHLQGDYYQRSLEELQAWNDAVFSLGSQMTYMDIRLEAVVAAAVESDRNKEGITTGDSGMTTHRLKLELATTVLPRATGNFLKLLQSPAGVGYESSILHRVEKKVGLMGGLVWNERGNSNNQNQTNKSMTLVGRCHEDFRMPTSWTNMDVSAERLVLSHVPGVLTMVSPRVHEIDSRYLLCSDDAPHLDGKSVAIGRLADEESLQTVQQWEQTLITHKGRPTNVVLRIVECGLLETKNQENLKAPVVVTSENQSLEEGKIASITSS